METDIKFSIGDTLRTAFSGECDLAHVRTMNMVLTNGSKKLIWSYT